MGRRGNGNAGARHGAIRKPTRTVLTFNRKKMIERFKSTWIHTHSNQSNAAIVNSMRTDEFKLALLHYLSDLDSSITLGDVDRWICTHPWIKVPGAHAKGLENWGEDGQPLRNFYDDAISAVVNAPATEFQGVPPPPSTYCNPGRRQENHRAMPLVQTPGPSSNNSATDDVVLEMDEDGPPLATPSQNPSPIPVNVVIVEKHEVMDTHEDDQRIPTDVSEDERVMDTHEDDQRIPMNESEDERVMDLSVAASNGNGKTKKQMILNRYFSAPDNPGSSTEESSMEVEVGDYNQGIPSSGNFNATSNENLSSNSQQETSPEIIYPDQNRVLREASSPSQLMITKTISLVADQQPGPSSSTVSGCQQRNGNGSPNTLHSVSSRAQQFTWRSTTCNQSGIRNLHSCANPIRFSNRSHTCNTPNGYQGWMPQPRGGLLPPYNINFRTTPMFTNPTTVTGAIWPNAPRRTTTPLVNQLLRQRHLKEQELEILKLATRGAMSLGYPNQQHLGLMGQPPVAPAGSTFHQPPPSPCYHTVSDEESNYSSPGPASPAPPPGIRAVMKGVDVKENRLRNSPGEPTPQRASSFDFLVASLVSVCKQVPILETAASELDAFGTPIRRVMKNGIFPDNFATAQKTMLITLKDE